VELIKTYVEIMNLSLKSISTEDKVWKKNINRWARYRREYHKAKMN